MGSYVIRLKVLPEDTTTNLDQMLQAVTSALPGDSRIRAHKVEPIAFGLSAVIVDVVTPEEEGKSDAVERAIASVPLVNQSEMMGVSRMSSKLPNQ